MAGLSNESTTELTTESSTNDPEETTAHPEMDRSSSGLFTFTTN